MSSKKHGYFTVRLRLTLSIPHICQFWGTTTLFRPDRAEGDERNERDKGDEGAEGAEGAEGTESAEGDEWYDGY